MRAASKASSFRRSPSRISTVGRFEPKGDHHGKTCRSLGVHVEGSGDGVGVLREDLRLEGAALAAGQLPPGRDRRERRDARHQRRHPQAGSRRPLARQHALLHPRRRPRGLPREDRRGGRADPRRGAGSSRHGHAVAVHRSRGPHERPVEGEGGNVEEEARQEEIMKGTPAPHIKTGPAGKTVRVTVKGELIAESRDAIALEEGAYPVVYYFPRRDVKMDRLDRSSHKTHCPFKGDASYFSLKGGPQNAVWSYEAPFDDMLVIKDLLAFYPDKVDISAA